MDFKEILGLEDIDAEEMVLVVGGGWVVNTGNGSQALPGQAGNVFATGAANGAPFTFMDDGGGGT